MKVDEPSKSSAFQNLPVAALGRYAPEGGAVLGSTRECGEMLGMELAGCGAAETRQQEGLCLGRFLAPWLGDLGSDPVEVTRRLVGEGDSTENNPN